MTLLTELGQLDSINPNLVPGGAGEGKIAQHTSNWARGQGLEFQLIELVPGRPSVVVARDSRGGRSLMLNGHINTVGVASMTDPFSAHRKEASSTGVCYMNGRIAAYLWPLYRQKTLVA